MTLSMDSLKLSCDSRFQRAFTACIENATTCSKRMRKTLVATQPYDLISVKFEQVLAHLPPRSGTFPTLTLVNAFSDLVSGATDET